MLVNGIERCDAIEHKGMWYNMPAMPLLDYKKNEKEDCFWQRDVLYMIGYDKVEYHFYEYKEWGNDYNYTVLETFGGTKVYTYNKKIHRFDDKPALIGSAGAKVWYKHNKCHRELGPALIDDSDKPNKQWLQNDVLHNEYGPAYIVDGETRFYIKGSRVFPENLHKYKGLKRFAKTNILL